MGTASKVPTDPNMTPEVRAYLDDLTKQVDSLVANLGLGTAAFLDVGTAASKVVQLTAAAKLPAVDGSLLTNLPAQTGRLVAGTALVLNPYATSSSTSQAHGLGATPIVIQRVAECLSADLNYSAGDQVLDWPYFLPIAILTDGTNVTLITASTTPQITNKTSFALSVIAVAKWKLTLTPYKLI